MHQILGFIRRVFNIQIQENQSWLLFSSIADAFDTIDDFLIAMDGIGHGVVHRRNLENACQAARDKIADLEKKINKDHEKKEELERELAEYGIQYIVDED